ncbi:MAG: tetratricopeptide repeat protein [Melioribacteraceae bacterium]|nr:tetratricopeptide repeat protein [Melioribacteraceae bacterium]
MRYKIILISIAIVYFIFNAPLAVGRTTETIPGILKDSLPKINSLLDSCWIYRTQDPYLALEFGKSALQIIDDKELISLKPKALNYLGVVYRKLGDLEKSYDYFKHALNLANVLKDSVQIGYTYNNLTDYYLKKASYSVALENVLLGYQIFENLNHKIGMAYSLNYLGEIYIYHGDYEKALSFLKEASKLRLESNDMRGYSNSITNIGLIHFSEKRLDSAKFYYKKALKINNKIKYRKGVSNILSLLGDIYIAKDEFKRAFNNVNAALLIDEKISNVAGQIINLNKLGLILQKQHKYQEAQKKLDVANKLAIQSGHLDQEMLSYLYLSKLYTEKKMPEKALASLNKYITIKDSIYSTENMGRFADLQTLFATNKKEIENKLLLKEIEFSTRNNYYLLIISLVTLIIIILLVSKFRTQRKTNNLLKELNSSKDKFFSILAHDLKNPFQGLLGYTEMLHTDYESLTEDEIKESIASLYSVSRNVYSLLEGLLEWSRAQTGRMEYNPILFRLSEEAERVVKLLKENALVKGVSLSSELDETTLVYADRNMVSTILRNLVANGIKYTNEGNLVKILAEKRKNEVVITVYDHGIGMSQEEMDSLFRIDVHHTTLGTQGEEGTGVGLILCKELVNNNGGKIWVESELGKGSKFIFTLPSIKK